MAGGRHLIVILPAASRCTSRVQLLALILATCFGPKYTLRSGRVLKRFRMALEHIVVIPEGDFDLTERAQ